MIKWQKCLKNELALLGFLSLEIVLAFNIKTMAKSNKVKQVPIDKDRQEIINSFRHLRKQLSPFLSPEYQKIMEQVEKLANNENVTPTTPIYKLAKTKKLTKKELYNYYLAGRRK